MRNTIKCFFVVNPCTTQISFPFLAADKYHFIDHKLVFATIRANVYILSVLMERDHFVPGVNVSYLLELMLEVRRLLKDK